VDIIKATPKFLRLAHKVMSKEALQKLIDMLATQPEKGIVIEGTGGIRKLRWKTGKNNKGKRGGVRILYYYSKGQMILLLLTLFEKSDKENIDMNEKISLKKLLPKLLEIYSHE